MRNEKGAMNNDEAPAFGRGFGSIVLSGRRKRHPYRFASFTRSRYSPVSVSMRTTVPASTKRGTMMS